jgi:hypothetical protein
MTYLRYVCVALASALAAVYTTLWLASPAPLEQHTVTMPPLRVLQLSESLLLWGSWRTMTGYDHGTANAVEISCNREQQVCTEAYATILHHDAGEDLEAQVFNYRVSIWDDQHLLAVAPMAVADCIDRELSVDLVNEAATLEWQPSDDSCEGDVGKAVLVGDPL